MEDDIKIIPPMGEDDIKGAERACEEFFILYQPTLSRIERHLETIISHTSLNYVEAYLPWQQALRDLIRGVYLTVKKIPLPNYEAFLEALHIFSFESAIQFLRDLCTSCNIDLSQSWEEKFREHINMLLFSVSILNRKNVEHGLVY